MQYCPKCSVKIRGTKSRCPLCQGVLTGTPEDPAFPALRLGHRPGRVYLAVVTFLFLAVEIIMGMLLTQTGLPFFRYAMMGAGAVWLDLVLLRYIRHDPICTMTLQVAAVLAVLIAVDLALGWRGWSVAWAVPIGLLLLAFATIATGKAMRMLLAEYIIWLALDMVLALFQIIPILRGANPFAWPAAISIAAFLIMGSAAVLFRHRDLRNASDKLFYL